MNKFKSFNAFLLVCAVLAPTLAFYENDDTIVELTPSNFDRLVMQSDKVWIIQFYAPGCGHCKHFAAEFKKLAHDPSIMGKVKVGAMNADEYSSFCDQYGVNGYPTVKIFGANKQSSYEISAGTASDMAQNVLDEVNFY